MDAGALEHGGRGTHLDDRPRRKITVRWLL